MNNSIPLCKSPARKTTPHRSISHRLVWITIWIIGILVCPIPASSDNESGQTVFKLTYPEILAIPTGKSFEFPKYTRQLINIANRNAQATRPRYIGQLSDLIRQFDGHNYAQWVKWYERRYPDAIETATDRTWHMIQKMRQAMDQIDREMVGRWIRELVLQKTYIGLRLNDQIIQFVANRENATYRFSTPEEESKGIDGYICGTAVSVKPTSYRSQQMLHEQIQDRAVLIYYQRAAKHVTISYNPHAIQCPE